MTAIARLIAALQDVGLISAPYDVDMKMTAEDIADMLWLLLQIEQRQNRVDGMSLSQPSSAKGSALPSIKNKKDIIETSISLPKKVPPLFPIAHKSASNLYLHSSTGSETSNLGGTLFRSPAASALPNALDIARALRPLMRRIHSRTKFILDGPATVHRIAETNQVVWAPVLRPAPMRWFELALVIDTGASMAPWRQTIEELRTLLEHHGAFRDVRMWQLATDDKDRVAIYAGINTEVQQEHNPRELIDPSGQRQILIISDCVSPAWHSGMVQQVLEIWEPSNIVTLIQMLPQRLWPRTALCNADLVHVHLSSSKKGNAGIVSQETRAWLNEDREALETWSHPFPIVTLEPSVLVNWARMITGVKDVWIPGGLFYRGTLFSEEEVSFVQENINAPSVRDYVRQFRAIASSMAWKLLCLLSAAPISLPVIRLIQQSMLPDARQVHVAEVFLSGLLEEVSRDETTKDPDYIEYDFLLGVREVLQSVTSIPDAFQVIDTVSTFMGNRYGQLHEFYALAATSSSTERVSLRKESRPFAMITAKIWRRFGGTYYASLADRLEQLSHESYIPLLNRSSLSNENGLFTTKTSDDKISVLNENEQENIVGRIQKDSEKKDIIDAIDIEKQKGSVPHPIDRPKNVTRIRRIMISSTARDLPEHRDKVKEACLRQGMFPMTMDHLPATSDDAIKASLKMVDEADIYLGIFAYRYGYIPEGHKLSITEMEYDQAVKRKIPCLIFIMHDDHPIKGSEIEKGAGAIKIEALKERMKKAQVVNFFKSPEELAILVINSLSQYRESDLTEFHYISEIPTPPEAYIAHPYVLLQTRLLGRRDELNMLTDWVTRTGTDIYRARILSIVAIGGVGKSALTWKWFNDIAPHEMNPLAGRMWWSFYESDASFENFVIRALAYVSRRSREDTQKLSPIEREEQLLTILDREPFLIVLDGLERVMVAYARMDAARLADDDLDQKTANVIVDGLGLPASAAQSFTGQYRLRKTANPGVGNFLRKLANVRATRILVSTRLYPADLQTSAGSERFGSKGFFLRGLIDEDALNMWRAFGVSGPRETLLPLFHTFDNQPLLIQALAGVVAQDRRFPGDFDRWSKAHPAFNPFQLPLVQVKSHILAFAMSGLDETSQKVLHTLAAFRMPVGYDTLVNLFVGEGQFFRAENELIAVLANLEDRGLMGWDRRANRYDLHPIVRGVIWSDLDEKNKQNIYQELEAHFELLTISSEEQNQKVNSIEELTPIIELYNALIGLERYEEAYTLYHDRLNEVMLYDLSALRQTKDLLESLFPDGLDQLPHVESPRSQAFVLNSLGISFSDQLMRAVELTRRSIEIDQKSGNLSELSLALRNLSNGLRLSGLLYESEATDYRALSVVRQLGDKAGEAWCLSGLGRTLAYRGIRSDSARALHRSLEIVLSGYIDRLNDVYADLATHSLWDKQYTDAQAFADRARVFSEQNRYAWGVIRAIRLQGVVALEMGDLPTSEERFYHALVRARKANFMHEELAVLIGLTELQRRQGDLKSAREFLDDVWEAAERGPFRHLQADAFNVLAQIERDAGNHLAAVEAAVAAYRYSWCDGPPYTYHWGLESAKAHLLALKVPEPIMPPFDPSKYEPMPKFEI